jgi:hypothetical protein
MRRALRPLAFAAALALAHGARADTVDLDLTPCAGAAPEEVRRILAIELKDGPRASVRSSCVGETAELTVSAAGASRGRAIDLGAEPASTRARVLALAIAEVVAELREPPLPQPKPQASPEIQQDEAPRPAQAQSPRAPPEKKTEAEARANAWRWTGIAHARATASGVAAFGVGTRLARGLGWLDVSVDALADHASPRASIGRVDVDTLTLGVQLLATRRVGAVGVFAGPGARLGVARMSGSPAAPDRARGEAFVSPWGGPMAAIGARVAPRGLVLEASGEIGYALGRVDALVDGAREIELGGVWGGAQLAVGGAF